MRNNQQDCPCCFPTTAPPHYTTQPIEQKKKRKKTTKTRGKPTRKINPGEKETYIMQRESVRKRACLFRWSRLDLTWFITTYFLSHNTIHSTSRALFILPAERLYFSRFLVDNVPAKFPVFEQARRPKLSAAINGMRGAQSSQLHVVLKNWHLYDFSAAQAAVEFLGGIPHQPYRSTADSSTELS